MKDVRDFAQLGGELLGELKPKKLPEPKPFKVTQHKYFKHDYHKKRMRYIKRQMR